MRRRDFLGSLAATATAAASAALWPIDAPAAAWPERPLRLLLGFPPGTAADLIARALAQELTRAEGWTVVVDNRPGAGGQIATQAVAKSPADGCTLLLGELGSIAIAPAAFGKLPYDPARELLPLATLAASDFVFLVPASLSATSVADYVAALRARPDKALFSTLGAGSPVHFGGELFAAAAGFAVEPVHFRSAADATAALAAGDVQGGFASVAVAKMLVATGRIRALATTAAQRSPLLPQVPTFAESGYPTVAFTSWFALFAPTGTPEAAQQALSRAFLAALKTPELQGRLGDNGLLPLGGTIHTARALVAAETERWARVVRASGFKGD